jgi:hypothetical protein
MAAPAKGPYIYIGYKSCGDFLSSISPVLSKDGLKPAVFLDMQSLLSFFHSFPSFTAGELFYYFTEKMKAI